MTIIDQMAEAQIEQAIARGELNDLPGQGKPLQLEDDSMIPEEFRPEKVLMLTGNISYNDGKKPSRGPKK